jgi:hypothetical protein
MVTAATTNMNQKIALEGHANHAEDETKRCKMEKRNEPPTPQLVENSAQDRAKAELDVRTVTTIASYVPTQQRGRAWEV